MKLHLGKDFSLPLDFVTTTQAILAKRGVGKSYTASVEAEELLKAKQQIAVIDPTGAWWGLKSSADGKHEGFSIVIFGGEHGDLPLEEGSGEIIATALVEHRFSAILDLSLFRKGQINRFMTPFLETLYRRNRQAMHLFADEADAIAPQRPFGEEARMLGAMEDVVRRGRLRGIGCTLITQRPAVLNKNVLTQCEMVCTLRLVHPKDIGALMEWVNVHADPSQAKEMLASLPSLPTGTAWFWAPGWGDIFQKVAIRKRETFDSGRTPKAGERIATVSVLAPIDLKSLGEQIASTAQRAKENDPKELKRKIADLERRVTAANLVNVTESKIVEVLIVKDEDISQIEKFVQDLKTWHTAHAPWVQLLNEALDRVSTLSGKLLEVVGEARRLNADRLNPPRAPSRGALPRLGSHSEPHKRDGRAATLPRLDSYIIPTHDQPNGLPKGEGIMLRAIAQYAGEGIERDALSVLTGYKRSSRDAYISRLRERGYVEQFGEKMVATQPGIQALGSKFDPLPTGQALIEFWRNRLPTGELAIFEFLVRLHGSNTTRERIDDVTKYKRSSRDAYLSRLSARKLIETGPGWVRATARLFE